jgi:hypothetical protein
MLILDLHHLSRHRSRIVGAIHSRGFSDMLDSLDFKITSSAFRLSICFDSSSFRFVADGFSRRSFSLRCMKLRWRPIALKSSSSSELRCRWIWPGIRNPHKFCEAGKVFIGLLDVFICNDGMFWDKTAGHLPSDASFIYTRTTVRGGFPGEQ